MRKGWKDISSRSMHEAEDSPPTTTELSLDSGRLRLIVHHHIDFDAQWLLSCYPGLFDKHVLSELALDDAQKVAEVLVETRLRRWAALVKKGGA